MTTDTRRTMNRENRRLANYEAENKLDEQAEARERARQADLTKRFGTETLYRVGPNDDAKLIDGDGDSSYRSQRVRDADGLAWAEQRLQSLGISLMRSGRVKQYVEIT